MNSLTSQVLGCKVQKNNELREAAKKLFLLVQVRKELPTAIMTSKQFHHNNDANLGILKYILLLIEAAFIMSSRHSS